MEHTVSWTGWRMNYFEIYFVGTQTLVDGTQSLVEYGSKLQFVHLVYTHPELLFTLFGILF